MSKSTILLVAFFLLISGVNIGAAAETIVQPGSLVQAAVDTASSGDTIILKPGTYTENIKITKSDLTIRSESGNPDDTMIKAKNSTDNALFVQADNVKISGIKAAAATAESTSGICLSGCNNCVIENNKLTSNGRGIYIVSSKGCTISGNTIVNNGYYGIVLGSSNSNTISGNTATNDGRGIYMGNSDDNTVSSNTVTLNSVLGFYSCSLCDRNQIYNNYFNNTEISVKSGSGNSYNTTKTPGTNIIGGSYIGGNYWGKPDGTGFSDTAVDKDGDGISDSAYSLPSSSYVDYLPLVYPSNSPEPVPPVAGFSSDVTSGNAPLTVTFKDGSTGGPTNWDWDFGDGNVSTEQNPVHTYTSAGTYTVKLTVSNADGMASKDGTITVLQTSEPVAPVADFSSDVTSGNAPLTVTFTDMSTGSPTSWNWDFGDGTSSADQSPVHAYSSAGTYTITLTVSNANGIAYKTLEINVLEAGSEDKGLPVADFGTNATQGHAPLSVQFTDLSQNAVSWSWDFDNNGQADSTDRNPVYVYEVPGDYTVNLAVSNENGTTYKTLEIKVEEKEGLPVADFNANVTNGYPPLAVLFTDLSQDATSWSWDFGDGVTSTEHNPTHVYFEAGTYTANLIATNENGTVSKALEIDVMGERHSGGSSHSSGGGGGGSPEPAKNVKVKELSQVYITNDKKVKFDFTKNATCVAYVGFDAKKTAGKVTTIAEELKNESTLVSGLPEGEVYKYFNVWVGNGGYATEKNIENPVLCFKVEKSWIQDNKIDQDSIILNRYSDKTWEQIPVSLSGEDSDYLYFTGDVPGYSFFAVTGKTKSMNEENGTGIGLGQETRSSETQDTNNIEAEVKQSSEQDESTSAPGFEMIYGIACVLAVFLYRRK
jgi:PGF-pre-PGF domain-containing protein